MGDKVVGNVKLTITKEKYEMRIGLKAFKKIYSVPRPFNMHILINKISAL